MRLPVLVLLGLLQPASAYAITTQAPTVTTVFEHYGLFGEWAVNCGAEASPSNPHVLVTRPADDMVLEKHELGEGYTVNTYRMLTAEPVSPTRIAVEALFQSDNNAEQRQRLVFSVRAKTRRTLFTKVDGGPVRVKDGMAVGYGVKTPRLEKCG
jgi:hypothetical protein